MRKASGHPDARRPRVIIALFGLLLLGSASISFLGYRYLEMSSEFRMRNFMYLNAINTSLDVIAQSPILRRQTIDTVRENTLQAREQVTWCIESLSMVERLVVVRLGGEPAFDICLSGLIQADRALDLLARIDAPEALQAVGPNSSFALGLKLKDVLGLMRRRSQSFHPYVNQIEQGVSKIVKIGTAVGTLALFVLLGFLSRHLLQGWKRQRQQSDQIERAHVRFKAAIDASSDGFAVVDQDGILLACNENFRNVYSPFPEQVHLGTNIEDVFRAAVIGGHYAKVSGENCEPFIEAGLSWMRGNAPEKRFALARDRFIEVKVNQTEVGDTVLIVTDVTDFLRTQRELEDHMRMLVSANKEIEYRSLHDPLTNLANRRYLDEQIAARDDVPLTMLHLDLDRFKQINDLMGHAAGDFVLKHVASILKACTRDEDLVARVGGDEFAILCREGTTKEDAHAIAERILDHCSDGLTYRGKPCYLGTSIGIARTGERENVSKLDLLNTADAALYEAKQAGKGRICLYTPELQARIAKDRDLTKRFQSALRDGEFVPFYQTQHAADDWSVSGVEVLARWRHPEQGILSPDAFLHIARQLGLENELDALIFDLAIADITRLDDQNLHVPRLSFNVSAGRILDPDFIETVQNKIPRPRNRVAFEILETVSLEELGAPLRFSIDTLREAGFRIEIDDFGSGHASIKSVLDIAPHALKIDRGLVAPLQRGTNAGQMITSIIEIGRALGVSITAEGVETEDQAVFLNELGCNTLQGYFFSRPVSALDLADRMKTATVRSG